MPYEERETALENFTGALWRAWTKAGPLSYNEFERFSEKVLGPAQALRGSTVHGILKNKQRRQPPRWDWVARFWTVLRVCAAKHGIDPDSLGSLEALKRLHEAADPSQRSNRQLASMPRAGNWGKTLTGDAPGHGHGHGVIGMPWQESPLPFCRTALQHEEVLASIRRKIGVEWWHDYNDVVPRWFGTYLSLERAASLIHVYDTAVVPGLLQTEAYANAVLRLEPYALPAATISRIIELRLQRQQIIGQPNAPKFWAILDESTLRRRIGDTNAMRGQIARLIDISAQPNVTIQMIPSATGIRTTLAYPITLLRFRVHEVPDMVYLEQLTSAFYLYDPNHVSRYVQVLEGLVLEALQPAETAEYLTHLLQDF